MRPLTSIYYKTFAKQELRTTCWKDLNGGRFRSKQRHMAQVTLYINFKSLVVRCWQKHGRFNSYKNVTTCLEMLVYWHGEYFSHCVTSQILCLSIWYQSATAGAPNYYPNSFNGPTDDMKYAQQTFSTSGDVARYNTKDDDNFTQPGNFWRNVLSPSEQNALVSNMAGHLKGAQDFLQKRAVCLLFLFPCLHVHPQNWQQVILCKSKSFSQKSSHEPSKVSDDNTTF